MRDSLSLIMTSNIVYVLIHWFITWLSWKIRFIFSNSSDCKLSI